MAAHHSLLRFGAIRADSLLPQAFRQCHAATMSTRGHTLVELLAVLCILAVLAGLATPSLRALQAQTQLTTAADHLQVALQLARSTALTRAQAVVWCLADDQGRCLPADSSRSPSYALRLNGPTGELLRREPLASGLQLMATRAHITYYPLPRAGSTSTVTLCDLQSRASSRQLIISQTGRVRTAQLTQRGCA